MRKNILRTTTLALVLANCIGEPDSEPGFNEKVLADGTRVLRSDTGRLSAPSTEDAATIAADFLALHADVTSSDELTVESRSTRRNGVTHLRIAQTVDGLRVHGAYAKVAVSADGEVVHAIERLARPGEKIAPVRIDEQAALAVAMTRLDYTSAPALARSAGNRAEFAVTEEFSRGPTVERVAYFGARGELRAGFLVETWSNEENQLHHTLVDGAGDIVSIEHRTAEDSYKVFVEDPLKGAQTVVAGPGAGSAQSPDRKSVV